MSQDHSQCIRVAYTHLPTRFGQFDAIGFRNAITGEEALAVVKGWPNEQQTPLVRIHSQCLTGDALHSLRCDCGEQLEEALTLIETARCGILVYLMQEGRGIGLLNKLRCYELQDQGVDTVDANLQLGFEIDQRSYQFCTDVLKALGATKILLLSNNPDKIRSLEALDIEIEERIPLIINPSAFSTKYLQTKRDRLGHLLD